ncbi:hypothetical protein D3C87_1946770 [compost metagenome]
MPGLKATLAQCEMPLRELSATLKNAYEAGNSFCDWKRWGWEVLSGCRSGFAEVPRGKNDAACGTWRSKLL